MLVEAGDWMGLARALRAMIRRQADRATAGEQLELWSRLGDVARERLDDRDAAIAAYEVAVALDPANVGRHEQLAELYLAAGPSHVDKAGAELQLLLRQAPDRLELYRQLHALYRKSGQRDKSYCLAQALVFLGHASEAQRAEAAGGRPDKLPLAKRRLTEELWQKAILHPREDRVLSGIFGLLTGALAATTAQPRQALALNPKEQVGADEPHPRARLFRYAAGLLGISPLPELYLRARAEGGVMAANVADKGVLAPALIVGEPHLSRASDAETAFELARRLSFFRPERYVIYALGSAARLEAALAAALVTSAVLPPGRGPDVDKLVDRLARTVPQPVLEHVAALARKHPAASGNGAIAPAVAGWIVATDLSANRVGLIVAGDLETAARAVATDKHPTTTLGAKERLRELLGYWVSEEHFAVRRHLGLEIA
jgi:tetratricopeptide (TPR) repeat protein